MREKGTRIATFVRLPLYQNYLRSLDPMPETISAASIANALGFGEVQVRKDLACVCGGGRPRIGYITGELLKRIETATGHRGSGDAVLIGAGKLGRALMDYGGFEEYGIQIVAGFDGDPRVIGRTPGGKTIFSYGEMHGFCSANGIRIGIVTVPAAQAQAVCSDLVAAGIRAIWCFAPTRLTVPEGVIVRYENLAASLAALSTRLDEISK